MFEDDLVSFVDSSQYHKRLQAIKNTSDWQNKHTHIAEFLAIKGLRTSVELPNTICLVVIRKPRSNTLIEPGRR